MVVKKQMNSAHINLSRTIVLVGLMGAGKTTIGKVLAKTLGVKFVDSDKEIETAAHMEIPEIFAKYGEAYFRAGEKKVIARLLNDPPHVLATGGGAFVDSDTRALIKNKALSIWLQTDLDELMARVKHKPNRPLLKTPDPKAKLKELMEIRYPIYAKSDITVSSRGTDPKKIVDDIIEKLKNYEQK